MAFSFPGFSEVPYPPFPRDWDLEALLRERQIHFKFMHFLSFLLTPFFLFLCFVIPFLLWLGQNSEEIGPPLPHVFPLSFLYLFIFLFPSIFLFPCCCAFLFFLKRMSIQVISSPPVWLNLPMLSSEKMSVLPQGSPPSIHYKLGYFLRHSSKLNPSLSASRIPQYHNHGTLPLFFGRLIRSPIFPERTKQRPSPLF